MAHPHNKYERILIRNKKLKDLADECTGSGKYFTYSGAYFSEMKQRYVKISKTKSWGYYKHVAAKKVRREKLFCQNGAAYKKLYPVSWMYI